MKVRGALTLALSAVISVAIAPPGVEAATYQMNVKTVSGAGDKCMSVPNGPFVEGMRVLLWDCNNMLAQTLGYDDQTQQLKFGANCVEVLGQGRAQDAIGVGTCNGAATQRWSMVPDKDNYFIVGVNGLCLNISNGVPANGTPLEVAPCTPNNVVEVWALYQAADTAAAQSQPASTPSAAPAQSQPAPTPSAAPAQSQSAAAPSAAPAQSQAAPTPSAAPVQSQPALPSSGTGTPPAAAGSQAAVGGAAASGLAMPENCELNLNKCSLSAWPRNSFPHRGFTQSVRFSNGMTLTCTSNGPDTPRSCTLK